MGEPSFSISDVSSTMLIALYARAVETEESPVDCSLQDRLMNAFSKFNHE